MSNVIYVDFTKKFPAQNDNKCNDVPILPELDSYLSRLRSLGLDEDDVQDVHDAIMSVDAYLEADDDIKTFAVNFLDWG